jgi:hypothetical protein
MSGYSVVAWNHHLIHAQCGNPHVWVPLLGLEMCVSIGVIAENILKAGVGARSWKGTAVAGTALSVSVVSLERFPETTMSSASSGG